MEEGTAKTPEPFPWRGVFYGSLMGTLCFIAGFFLVDYVREMGLVLFLMVPIITGFAIALVTPKALVTFAAIPVTLIFFFAFLLWTGLEGIVCCMMATPIMAVGIFLGALVGIPIRKRNMSRSKRGTTAKLLILGMMPFFVLGADSLEKSIRGDGRIVNITSTVVLPVSPQEAWDMLGEIESLSGEKPFLLKIGLPVPTRCVLEREAVGARRTCYFEQGTIEETITEWDPPRTLTMDITSSSLPGRHWLTYVSARYVLTQVESGTRIERTTTIHSRLSPRWYWEPLETWGVDSMHQYLFNDLARRTGPPKNEEPTPSP